MLKFVESHKQFNFLDCPRVIEIEIISIEQIARTQNNECVTSYPSD